MNAGISHPATVPRIMNGATSQGTRRNGVRKTKTGVQKMDFGDMARVGVIAGIAVAIVSALIIWMRAGNIAAAAAANPNTVGFGFSGLGGWIVLWTVISLVFGLLAAWVYDFVATKWNWGMPQYLGLAVGLAVVLTVLAYMKIYGGQSHPYAAEWLGLNFAYAVGFGYLIPTLAG